MMLPDALRAVVAVGFDAGLIAAVFDGAAGGFFSKNSVTVAWAVDLVFFTGLTYASLSSSSLSGLSYERNKKNATVRNL